MADEAMAGAGAGADPPGEADEGEATKAGPASKASYRQTLLDLISRDPAGVKRDEAQAAFGRTIDDAAAMRAFEAQAGSAEIKASAEEKLRLGRQARFVTALGELVRAKEVSLVADDRDVPNPRIFWANYLLRERAEDGGLDTAPAAAPAAEPKLAAANTLVGTIQRYVVACTDRDLAKLRAWLDQTWPPADAPPKPAPKPRAPRKPRKKASEAEAPLPDASPEPAAEDTLSLLAGAGPEAAAVADPVADVEAVRELVANGEPGLLSKAEARSVATVVVAAEQIADERRQGAEEPAPASSALPNPYEDPEAWAEGLLAAAAAEGATVLAPVLADLRPTPADAPAPDPTRDAAAWSEAFERAFEEALPADPEPAEPEAEVHVAAGFDFDSMNAPFKF